MVSGEFRYLEDILNKPCLKDGLQQLTVESHKIFTAVFLNLTLDIHVSTFFKQRS